MRCQKKEKGASAVEFALVLPLLVLLLFGIVEFGFILYDKAVITNASREGARAGIVFVPPSLGGAVSKSDIETVVADYCKNNLVSLGSVTAAPSTAVKRDGSIVNYPCSIPGSALTVTVTYPYTFLALPRFAKSLTGDITLSATTVMNCENQ